MNQSGCGSGYCDCGSSTVLNECLWKAPYGTPTAVIVAIFFILILLFALVWNGLVIFIFIKDRYLLKEPSSVYLFLLAVVDTLEVVLSIPFYVVTLIAGEWIFGPTDAVREAVCIAVGYIFSLFLFTTVHLIALISFDRFLYIVHALNYRKWMNPTRALCLTGVVLIVPLILASTPLFGFGKLEFSPIIGLCVFRWEGQRPYVLSVAAEALLPVGATIVFTMWTYIYVKRFLRRKHARQISHADDLGNTPSRNKKVERTLTRTFTLLVISQAICFAPGIVTALVGFFVGYAHIPSEIFLIDFVIIVSNAGVNPLMQSLSRTRIRRYLSFLIHLLTCCRTHSVPVKESSDEAKCQEHCQSTTQTPSAACQEIMSQSSLTIRYNIDPIRGTLV